MCAMNLVNAARRGERGSALAFVTVSLFFFIGMAGLAIDLANLYVARSDTQRAADAAALAGATSFVNSGYTTGGVDTFAVRQIASDAAIAVGNQNLVHGQSPNIQIGDITFNLGNTANPRITVAVNPPAVPTMFMRAFGKMSYPVSATATAEAYNPSGQTGGLTFCASCLKPIAVPNSDPFHGGPFIDPTSGQISDPGNFLNGGIVGEQLTIHSATATCGVIPCSGPWYPISLDGNTDLAHWGGNVTSCNATLHTCNENIPYFLASTLGTPAQVSSYIDQLIHASADGPLNGQDTALSIGFTRPFTIFAGGNNPYFAGGGFFPTSIVQSDSIVTMPIYGAVNTGNGTVTIIGFMQLFIESVQPNGSSDDIVGMIVNISGCGTNGGTCGGGGGGGSGNSSSISGGGTSAIPVRLIHN